MAAEKCYLLRMKLISFALVLLPVGLVWLAGCQRRDLPAWSELFQDQYLRQEEGRTVARVDGLPITEAEILSWAESAPHVFEAALASRAGRQQFMDSLIRQRIWVQWARRSGADDLHYRLGIRRHRYTMLARALREKLAKNAVAGNAAQAGDGTEDTAPELTEVEASLLHVRSLQDAKRLQSLLQQGMRPESVKHLSVNGKPLPTPAAAPFDLDAALKKLKDGQASSPIKLGKGYAILRRNNTRRLPAPMALREPTRQIKEEDFGAQFNQVKADMKIEIDESVLDAVLPLKKPAASTKEP